MRSSKARCASSRSRSQPTKLEEVFTTIRKMEEDGAKKLLVIEDDETQRNSIRELIGNETAHLTDAGNAQEQASIGCDEEHFDCVVLDLLLPDHDRASI